MSDGERRRFGDNTYPRWIREIDLALPVRAQFVVTGNIRDNHRLPGDEHGDRGSTTVDVIRECLVDAGFQAVFDYDPIDGLGIAYESEEGAAEQVVSGVKAGERTTPSMSRLAEILRAVVHAPLSAAIIIDFASRLRGDDQDPPPALHELFREASKLAHTAQEQPLTGDGHHGSVYNPIFWLVDQEQDLPHWIAGIEPVRVVSIPLPSLDEREREACALLAEFPNWADPTTEEERAQAKTIARRFATATHGMGYRAMWDIRKLAQDSGIAADDVEEAVRAFRAGIPYNPWRDPDVRARIADARKTIGAEVLGQDSAIDRSVDILMRAAAGLTGAQSAGHKGRPQGVLFFAGPTGVGKTKLAKQIAQLVFGTEETLTRFDMSEFTLEQSEARLIGAPPGYVGHDAGGDLTNAVRQRPFSVLLFDEVEKAHPRILDLFLQILDDGRLTDGGGGTVYFSETIIVFTSNLGVYREVFGPNNTRTRELVITPEDPPTYEDRAAAIRRGIHEHFTLSIGRPELLNRIGEDNIIVFDFITEPDGRELVKRYIDNIVAQVFENSGISLDVPTEIVDTVADAAVGSLHFGGRGIGSAVETAFVNPLASALFSLPEGAAEVKATSLERDGLGWRMTLA